MSLLKWVPCDQRLGGPFVWNGTTCFWAFSRLLFIPKLGYYWWAAFMSCYKNAIRVKDEEESVRQKSSLLILPPRYFMLSDEDLHRPNDAVKIKKTKTFYRFRDMSPSIASEQTHTVLGFLDLLFSARGIWKRRTTAHLRLRSWTWQNHKNAEMITTHPCSDNEAVI